MSDDWEIENAHSYSLATLVSKQQGMDKSLQRSFKEAYPALDLPSDTTKYDYPHGADAFPQPNAATAASPSAPRASPEASPQRAPRPKASPSPSSGARGSGKGDGKGKKGKPRTERPIVQVSPPA